MARLRTLAEWEAMEGDEALTDPERRLIDCCRDGKVCSLGDGTRPEGPDPARTIRADLLRYLILGGCDACRVAEVGVQLQGAYVSGVLDLNFATAKGLTALVCCQFAAEVAVLQTRFELLNLSGSALSGLTAQGAWVTGDVFLRDGFASKGEVSLAGAKIGGQLCCTRGSFENEGGDALNAQSVEVTGGVFLDDGFEANGEVSLSDAKIGGLLFCMGGIFENEGGFALNAQGVKVTGNILLLDGFAAKGEVSLSGAKIGGLLSCMGGSFENEGGAALNAQRARVKGNVFLLDGFAAKGEVSLSGARIGGQLSCTMGSFENEGGVALNAQVIEVTGGVFLRNGFTAKGVVSLSGAKMGGQLDCSQGSFEYKGGAALDAAGMWVKAQFIWRGVTTKAGVIGLASAHVGDLVDDAASWPEGGRVILDGFTYDRISGASTDAQARLAWLAKGDWWQGEFFPQPYSQLAKVLREMGHDRAARKVLMKQEQLVRRHIRETARITPNGDGVVALKSTWADLRNLLRWLWDFVLRWLTGYGHAPVRSVIALAVLFLFATFLANRAWTEGSFAPNSDVILTSSGWTALASDPSIPNPADAWSAKGAAGQDWETFNRYAYGFDLVVPILTLGQTTAWAPSASRGLWGHRLWWARWVLESLGWIVTALGAAAITGIIRRE